MTARERVARADRLDKIEQAARVIGSVMSRWDMDGRPDVDGGIDTLIARTLDEAGLLAPDMQEEVAYKFPQGGNTEIEIDINEIDITEYRQFLERQAIPKERRWVTEWEEA